MNRWESAKQREMYEMAPQQLARLVRRSFGDVDTLRPLVLCVDFSDNVHGKTTGAFDTLLFSKDFELSTGSFRDYYLENSYGQHDPQGGVYGWVRAPQTYSYYTWGASGLGDLPHNAQQLVQDVLAATDPYVNFAEYDYDGNGWIDGLIVVHAGPGAEETGNDWHIWSHRWVINQQIRDGVWISSYTMQPEVHANGSLIDIGVFCHEWGHDLGILWEEYDRDYSSWGLGDWSVMATGCYNNGGKTPAHHSAYCKYFLGWTNVITVGSNQTNVEIIQAETSPVSYRLWTSGSVGSQFFMVENRQKTGFDSHLPGSGLLIYQVDVNKPGNDLEWCPGNPASSHFKTALEQADGDFKLEGCYGDSNQGDWGDPFPGYQNKPAFDDTTTPSSHDYYDDPTQVAVWNISDSDSMMYANMDILWSRPCLFLDSFIVDDSPPGGDGDGRPEGGETAEIYLTISNIWLPINNTTVTASADTEGIVFTDPTSNLGTIGTGDSVNNYLDPIEFEVDPFFTGRPTIITLHVEGNTTSGAYTLDFEEEIWAGDAEILIVDDDSGSAADYQSYYTAALDSLRTIYDIWDTEDTLGKGDPDFSFNQYRYLIWYTGDHKTDLFTPAQVESLMSFLDNGGRLFLTSQDAVEVLSGSANPLFQQFLTDYLHVGYGGNTPSLLIAGHPGDEVGDTLWIRPWSTPGANNQTSRDKLVPDLLSDTVLVHAGSGFFPTDSVAATKFQNDIFKVVVFGFGFEGISTSPTQFHGKWLSKPHFVMGRVLNWLRVSSYAGIVILDNSNYAGTDDRLQVTVIDFDLDLSTTQADTVSIKITSTTDKAGISVICTETGLSSGTFSGSCGFTKGLSDDTNDLISVSDDDTVTAIYMDQNPLGERRDEAVWTEEVDLEPPSFTVGILQNPIFSAELNIYSIASESLKTAPIISIGTDTLAVGLIYYEGETIYVSTYQLSASGNIQIRVVGTDSADNEGVHIETFAAGSITPAGGWLVSHDNVLRFEVGSGAVDKEEYFLVFIADNQNRKNHKLKNYTRTRYLGSANISWDKTDHNAISLAYSITPSQLGLKSKAKLSISYAGISLEERDPTKLTIYRKNKDIWRAMPSYLDSDKRQVVAFIDELGIYQLRYGDLQNPGIVPTMYSLKENYPNPFNNSTDINYEISSPGWVKIEIYNLLGQKVKTLVDEYKPPGRFTTEWNGVNEQNETVSTGIYFYTLKIHDFIETKKMIFLK